ncbi:alpha/beta fold hydrolase [Acholeplasma granularum]|uniref:alpha/beta fold hydrolase n=1 Tax=Acholeplasma granularum TaxID=264635 RepID=UPI00046E83FB|nr:alpha/beta hydrolase [Acholeplasma granularum]
MSYFKYLDKNVYYDIKGEGNPVLILNGIMMSTKSWEPFVHTISNNFMLIRLDFLDQGQSDSYETDYTQTVQVDLVKALLDHLNIDKVHLVGISYGGEVALQFALKYPNKLDRLIIYNSVAYTTKTLALTGHKWNEYAESRDTLNYYEATIPVIYSKEFNNKKAEWMANRKQILTNGAFKDTNFLDRMIRLTNSAENYDIRNNIKDITTPVMIVGAEDDYLTPLVHQRILNNNLPNSRLVILPNVGHASMYEVPEIFTTILIGFLKTELEFKI